MASTPPDTLASVLAQKIADSTLRTQKLEPLLKQTISNKWVISFTDIYAHNLDFLVLKKLGYTAATNQAALVRPITT